MNKNERKTVITRKLICGTSKKIQNQVWLIQAIILHICQEVQTRFDIIY
jgi:hypothetical protein